MKRSLTLVALVVAGAIVTAWDDLSARQAPAGRQGQPAAQGRGGGGGVGAIQKLRDNVFWIPGAGGNSTVYVHANGVVLVDTKLANNGQAILDQIRSVTDKPITHIINTHTHGDHNGSNQFFPASVEIVAQENTSDNMRNMEPFKQPANAHGLPDTLFADRHTLLEGNDTIDLYYFGAAHTNGDAWVLFRNARVLAAGDAFANTALPNVDRANGGSAVLYADTIGKACANLQVIDTIIGGHAPAPMKSSDLCDYAEFLRFMIKHGRTAQGAGKSPEQTMKEFQAMLPDKFKGYGVGPGRGGPGGIFVTIFEELKGQ